ncbi:hypothetical protein DL96DRAFT_1821014 [Flagelloscypha sp. PMI_526]|nr:hypothetical protein DL96DRAFT_1821014 [Flagelloscypha sp. PMI_526]
MSPHGGAVVPGSALESLLPEPANSSTKRASTRAAKSGFKGLGNFIVTLYTAAMILCMNFFVFFLGALLGRAILDALYRNRPLQAGMSKEERGELELKVAALVAAIFSPFAVMLIIWSEKLVPKKWKSTWKWGPIAFLIGTALTAVSAMVLHVEVKFPVIEYVIGTGITLPVTLFLCFHCLGGSGGFV